MAARYRRRRPREAPRIGRIIKIVLVLVGLGALGLAGYAMLSDLPPPTREVVRDLPINGGGAMRITR